MQENIPKQRGIYSEILTTEDNDNLKMVSVIGPDKANLIETNARQKVPRARGLGSKTKDMDRKINTEVTKLKNDVDQHIQIVGKTLFREP